VPYYRNDKWLKKVGVRIRDIRIEKKMSQQQLAHVCGIDISQLNRMELGKVAFNVCYLKMLADGLKINPAKFLS